MFDGCQIVTFYAYDETSNDIEWMFWSFKFNYLLAESTTTSSLSSYENFDPKDYICLSKPPRTQGNKFQTIIEFDDEDVEVDDEIHLKNPCVDLYLNNESIKEISISNLWDVIVEKSRDENDGFKKEYEVCVKQFNAK